MNEPVATIRKHVKDFEAQKFSTSILKASYQGAETEAMVWDLWNNIFPDEKGMDLADHILKVKDFCGDPKCVICATPPALSSYLNLDELRTEESKSTASQLPGESCAPAYPDGDSTKSSARSAPGAECQESKALSRDEEGDRAKTGRLPGAEGKSRSGIPLWQFLTRKL